MAYSYPRNTVWFVEARPSDPEKDKRQPQSGSAVAVRLTDTKTGETKNYLLTCLHVVCSVERQRSSGVVTSLESFEDISCWPPGNGFHESQKVNARVSEMTAARSGLIGKPFAIGDDWVLLEVDSPEFQKTTVARDWEHPETSSSPDECDIIGYPDGATGFTTGIVENLHLRRISISRSGGDFSLRVDGDGTKPGMSGGGVFSGRGVLLGIHRSAQAPTAALYSVRARDIREELSEKNQEPVKRTLYASLFESACDIFVTMGCPPNAARKVVAGLFVLFLGVLLAIPISMYTGKGEQPVTLEQFYSRWDELGSAAAMQTEYLADPSGFGREENREITGEGIVEEQMTTKSYFRLRHPNSSSDPAPSSGKDTLTEEIRRQGWIMLFLEKAAADEPPTGGKIKFRGRLRSIREHDGIEVNVEEYEVVSDSDEM